MPCHVRRRLELSALGAVRPFRAVHPCTGLLWWSLLLPDVTQDTSISLSPGARSSVSRDVTFWEFSPTFLASPLSFRLRSLSRACFAVVDTRVLWPQNQATHAPKFLPLCPVHSFLMNLESTLRFTSLATSLYLAPPAPTSGCSSQPLLHLSYFPLLLSYFSRCFILVAPSTFLCLQPDS